MYSPWLFVTLVLFPLAFGRFVNLEPNAKIQEVGTTQFQRHPRNGAGIKRTLEPSLSIRSAPPAVLEITASQSKVLECEAGGNPPPTIHWLKDGERIPQSVYEIVHPSNSENEYTTPALGLSFTRSRLYVDCAGPKEEGTYMCVAENPFSRVSRTTELNVVDWVDSENRAICLAKKSFGAPARIHMWTHTRLELMGSDVQLFCRSNGEPKPQVTWLGPDDSSITVDTEKYQVLENGDLVIRHIDWGDMGGYTCEVKNPQGADSTLTFLYPTLPEKRKTTNA